MPAGTLDSEGRAKKRNPAISWGNCKKMRGLDREGAFAVERNEPGVVPLLSHGPRVKFAEHEQAPRWLRAVDSSRVRALEEEVPERPADVLGPRTVLSAAGHVTIEEGPIGALRGNPFAMTICKAPVPSLCAVIVWRIRSVITGVFRESGFSVIGIDNDHDLHCSDREHGLWVFVNVVVRGEFEFAEKLVTGAVLKGRLRLMSGESVAVAGFLQVRQLAAAIGIIGSDLVPGAGAKERLHVRKIIRIVRERGRIIADAGRVVVEVRPLFRIHLRGDHHLPLIVEAAHAVGLFLGVGKGWQKHRGEDGNHRDDDQEFDEGEGAACVSRRESAWFLWRFHCWFGGAAVRSIPYDRLLMARVGGDKRRSPPGGVPHTAPRFG